MNFQTGANTIMFLSAITTEVKDLLIVFSCSYDSSTGVFTVPPGRDGVYYFSTYLQIFSGKYADFKMAVNDVIVCTARADHSHNGDNDTAQAARSAMGDIVEGTWVFIF